MSARSRWLAAVLALCWGGCASLPLSHQAELEAQGKPYLTFSASPSSCVKPCTVTLKAEIHGDIHWCPTLIRWSYGDGTHDDPVMTCTERVFSAVRNYGYGSWSPSVIIYSLDQQVASPLVDHVSVGTQ